MFGFAIVAALVLCCVAPVNALVVVVVYGGAFYHFWGVRLMILNMALKSLAENLQSTTQQTSIPNTVEIVMLFTSLAIGGNTVKPAHTKAPSTVITENTSRIDVRINALRTICTAFTTNTASKCGKAASAPDTTVATAKKKERSLNVQNKRRL
jgi:NADH:ubiquinone oxidoreductase subunit 6 (subunit J)